MYVCSPLSSSLKLSDYLSWRSNCIFLSSSWRILICLTNLELTSTKGNKINHSNFMNWKCSCKWKKQKNKKTTTKKKKQKSNFVNKSALSDVIGNKTNKSTLRTNNTLSSGKKPDNSFIFASALTTALRTKLFTWEKDTFFHFSNLVLKASVIR